jgi:hypothetical protein
LIAQLWTREWTRDQTMIEDKQWNNFMKKIYDMDGGPCHWTYAHQLPSKNVMFSTQEIHNCLPLF